MSSQKQNPCQGQRSRNMLMQRSIEEAREAHMSKGRWALIFPLGPRFTRHYRGRDESAPMMRGAVLTAGFFCRLMLQMYSVLFLHFIHNANAISGTIAPPKEEQERGIQPKRKEEKKKKKKIFKMTHTLVLIAPTPTVDQPQEQQQTSRRHWSRHKLNGLPPPDCVEKWAFPTRPKDAPYSTGSC